MKRSLFISLAVFLFILGFSLRGIGLLNKGFFLYDEAYLCLESKPAVLAIQWTGNHLADILKGKTHLNDLKSFIENNGSGIYWPSVAKPGYYLLSVIFSLFFGVHDYSLFILSFVFGILALIAVFMFTNKYYGQKAALAATLILSVSSYHVYYSRVGLTVSAAAFFLLLGSYFYYLGRINRDKQKLILSGLLIGFAFTCHYNISIFLLIFFLCEIQRLFYERKLELSRKIKSLAYFLLSLLFFPIFFQACYLFINFLSGKPRSTYFEQILGLTTNAANRLISGPVRILAFLFNSEGLLVLVLFIIGLIYLLKRYFSSKKLEDGLFFLLATLPLTFWVIAGSKGMVLPRVIMPILPFVAIVAGIALAQFTKKIYLMLSILILLIGILISSQYIFLKSGYKELADFIKRNKYDKVVTFELTPILMFYLNNKNNVYTVNNLKELREVFYKNKVYLYCSDYLVDLEYDFIENKDFSLIEFESKNKPTFSFSHTIGTNYVVLADSFMQDKNLRIAQFNPLNNKLRLYYLKDIFK